MPQAERKPVSSYSSGQCFGQSYPITLIDRFLDAGVGGMLWCSTHALKQVVALGKFASEFLDSIPNQKKKNEKHWHKQVFPFTFKKPLFQ